MTRMTGRSITGSRLGAAVAGLAAGLLMAASLPPWGWWPLALVGAALLVTGWSEASLRRRLLWGTTAGLGFHAVGLWWISEFSVVGYVAATLAEAAILMAALALAPAGRSRFVGVPAALVVGQAIQDHWPFGGVPVDGIALGQVGGPLAPAARLGGHLLIVGLVGVAGSALTLLVAALRTKLPDMPFWRAKQRDDHADPHVRRRWGRLVAGGAGVALVGLAAAGGAVAPAGREHGTLRVAAVQGGGVRGLRAIDSVPVEVFVAQLRASERVRPPVDLVVWPEDVIDAEVLTGSPADETMAGLARSLGATVVAGVVEDAPGDHFRNAAVAWGPDGSRLDRYDKVRRVPFGEYVPGRALVRHLADLSAVPRDAIAGQGPGVLQTPAGRLGVLISYEVFFSDRARAAVRAGGTLLLVPTNASSFSTSQVPGQELAAARLRALETGRSVVQAAPTGYSAVIDTTGRVLARSDLGPSAVLERALRARTGQTLATRLGDGPATVGAVALLAVLWAVRPASRLI